MSSHGCPASLLMTPSERPLVPALDRYVWRSVLNPAASAPPFTWPVVPTFSAPLGAESDVQRDKDITRRTPARFGPMKENCQPASRSLRWPLHHRSRRNLGGCRRRKVGRRKVGRPDVRSKAPRKLSDARSRHLSHARRSASLRGRLRHTRRPGRHRHIARARRRHHQAAF